MHDPTDSRTSSSTPTVADADKQIAEICGRVAADMTRAGLECVPSDVRDAHVLMQLVAQYISEHPDARNKNTQILADTGNRYGMSAAIVLARMDRQLADADEGERLPLIAVAVMQALMLLQPPKLSKTLGKRGR